MHFWDAYCWATVVVADSVCESPAGTSGHRAPTLPAATDLLTKQIPEGKARLQQLRSRHWLAARCWLVHPPHQLQPQGRASQV